MIKKLIQFIFYSVFVFSVQAQNYPPQPNPPKLVVDYAITLSSYEAQLLEQKLVAYNDSTSTQIAIVIIKSTDGYPIDMYSFELGERWGIGRKIKTMVF